jgi:hypothetical protein
MRYTIESEIDFELEGAPRVWRAYVIDVDEDGVEELHYIEGTTAYDKRECQEQFDEIAKEI